MRKGEGVRPTATLEDAHDPLRGLAVRLILAALEGYRTRKVVHERGVARAVPRPLAATRRALANLVGDFLGEVWTLARLIALVEGLMAERVLSRKDGKQVEERLFQLADAEGRFHGKGVGDRG